MPDVKIENVNVYSGPPPVSDAEIDRRLDLHTPRDQDTRDKLDELRARFKALYRHVRDETPVSREQSLAFTHLEDALQAAIAAVVRPAPPRPGPLPPPRVESRPCSTTDQ